MLQDDDEDLDWGDGQQDQKPEEKPEETESEVGSLTDSVDKLEAEATESEQQRKDYISSMESKFKAPLDREVRRLETSDLSRRDIKHVENKDKLFDFIKIKDIKIENHLIK